MMNIKKSNSLQKKNKYVRKFRDEWLSQCSYGKWLIKKYDTAFCKVCKIKLTNSIYHIQRHGQNALHISQMKDLEKTPTITQFSKQMPMFKKLEDQTYRAELKMAMFIAEHNIPFNVLEHLPQLIKSCCPDSLIFSNVTCGRTKATNLLKHVIAPENVASIQSDLSDGITPYSLIIDETTDISTKKVMAVIIRYFRNNNEKVIDRFLELVECSDGTADGIYNGIINCLKNNNIPLQSMIGFGSDNCAVMMGRNNSVKTRLLKDVPTVFISGCSSHLIHLCAVAASSRLPSYIEELTRDLFSHFSCSTKRREEFIEYQSFLELQPHVILRAGTTRWLSLEVCFIPVLI